MKRILAILLALCTLLSLVACSSSLATDETETGEEATATAEKNAQTEEEKETGPITIPEGFSVGYSRKDMTTDLVTYPILSYNGDYAKSAHDPLQVTCVAIADGETAALIITIDMRNISDQICNRTKELISKAVDVPGQNIYINSSHTHTGIDINYDDPTVTRWRSTYYKLLPQVAEEAMRDLTPAEAYVGTSHTEGLTFVRRYIREDGTFTGIHVKDTSTSPIARHETEADNEMRVVRFDRGEEKDVIMVNYQTHYGSAGGLYPDQLSADFVHPFRETAEKELDCYFSYCNGASGNLVFNSRIDGERKYPTFVDATPHMVDTVKNAIASEEKAETGKIQVAHSDYEAKVRQYDADTIAKATEANNAGARTAEQEALVAKYGFQSRYEVSAIVAAASKGETDIVPFTAITFGEIGFVCAPYEMFDTNGQEIRAASPFKMTFTFGYTNGSHSYVPSAIAWPNNGYEVYTCRYAEGCGEEFAQEMVRLLNVCYTQAQQG